MLKLPSPPEKTLISSSYVSWKGPEAELIGCTLRKPVCYSWCWGHFKTCRQAPWLWQLCPLMEQSGSPGLTWAACAGRGCCRAEPRRTAQRCEWALSAPGVAWTMRAGAERALPVDLTSLRCLIRHSACAAQAAGARSAPCEPTGSPRLLMEAMGGGLGGHQRPAAGWTKASGISLSELFFLWLANPSVTARNVKWMSCYSYINFCKYIFVTFVIWLLSGNQERDVGDIFLSFFF